MSDVNEIAKRYVGTCEDPPASEAVEVLLDADRCAICGYWTWLDLLDTAGECESCVEGEFEDDE